MKRIAIKLTISLFFSLLPFHVWGNNINWNVGYSYIYLKVDDSKYDYNKKSELSSFSAGFSKFYKNNLNWTITTNRFFNSKIKKKVTRKSDGVRFKNETKIDADSLLLGYTIKRSNISIIFSSVKVEKFLYYKGSLVGHEKKEGILKGFNLGYFIHNNLVSSFSYVSKNREVELKEFFSFNINYIF